MERLINGTLFDVVMESPVIPVQVQVPSGATPSNNAIAWPATIASGGHFSCGTNPIAIHGLPHYAIGGLLTQAGTVTVQPYLDLLGNVPVGTLGSTAITASTPFVLDGNVGTAIVVQSIGVTITNGNGGAAATLSNAVLVLQSS